MRKIEIVSLVFVVVAVGVLMIALQMDDASARKWLFMLSVAMLILAYTMARRTIAKYREQMGIPVARLRKVL